jgi:hypothetical protein
MNNIRMWSITVAAVLITLLGSSTVAQAQVRRMLVLIDASGSMNIARPQDPLFTTRFEAAKDLAKRRIVAQSRLRIQSFAVYTFSGSTTTQHTAGFVELNEALATINGLDLFTVGGGVTPLAGSVCDAVDALVAATPGVNDTRVLQLSSDGEENSTPPGHQCAGPASADAAAPYTPGSWHNKVLAYVKAHDVSTYIDLFDNSQVSFTGTPRASDPDAMATARLARAGANLTAAPTLSEFFTTLAVETGGRLEVVSDQQAALPVFADFNGNACVDRSDALLVARAIGRTGEPQGNPLDLDADGVVGFADYALAVSSFTAGGCGTAEPYVARAPVTCTSSQPVVIDGQVLEGSGITINATSLCRITIRNSLIVSGQSAINVQGTAILTVDNSIVVGEGAWLTARGSTALSAANSVFHGARTTQGAFVFSDRGGNTFE